MFGLTGGQLALCIALGSLLVSGLVAVLLRNQLSAWIPFFIFLGGQIAGIVLGAIHRANSYGKAALITSSLLTVLAVVLCT